MLLITSTANIKTWERDNGLYGGLSPLARGTRLTLQTLQIERRFIPAGAGNSNHVLARPRPVSVYPRWRGELRIRPDQMVRQNGLSPLARGTPAGLKTFWRRTRFIPAGAGNSAHGADGRSAGPVYPRWRGELCKHNLLLINDFLSQSQSTNFIVSHKQHIHYVKEHLIHWLKR